MSNLSPAAQAVIDAAWKGVPAGMRDPYIVRCEQLAAGLRVAVDQVLPAASPLDRAYWSPFAAQIRSELLAIATGLENAS